MIAGDDAQPDGRQQQVLVGQDVFTLRQLMEFEQSVDLFVAGIGREVRKIVFRLAEAFGQEIRPSPAILWQRAERLKTDLRPRAAPLPVHKKRCIEQIFVGRRRADIVTPCLSVK